MEFLISVVVPIHNMEDYVGKCIESIINQTYRNLQIILVDDKSTDRSGAICDSYAMQDDRIQVIHNENNKGVVASTKAGLSVAKGEYIGRVDGDDWIENTMYEQLLKKIVDTDSDFAVTGYIYEGWAEYGYLVIGDAQGVFELSDGNRYSIIRRYFYGTVEDHCQRKRSMCAIWNKLYKAELLRNAFMQLPDYCIQHDDHIPLLIILLEAKRFVMIGGANYHYVKRKGSVVNSASYKRMAERSLGHDELKRILKKYNCFNELAGDADKENDNWMQGVITKKLNERFQIQSWYVWRFRDVESLSGKKIVLYGAGGVGENYYQQLSAYGQCEIVAWIDSNYKQYQYNYCKVQGIEVLNEISYDIIVVAVFAEKTACSIMSNLNRFGIEMEKVMWKRPEQVCIKMELTEK